MKYYLADILTFIRFVLTIVLFVMSFTSNNLGAAFYVFVIAELTDAFDGTCATKWPFPKGKTPKYRKYAAKYDMLTDTLLAIAMILFFLMQVNLVAGLIIGIGYGILAIIIDFVVYGKLLGHPDDYKKRSLMSRNFKLAKRLILARRSIYISLIALIALWTFIASNLPDVVKITTSIVAVVVVIFLWFFLSQRRHNISRDAVDIEKRLSK